MFPYATPAFPHMPMYAPYPFGLTTMPYNDPLNMFQYQFQPRQPANFSPVRYPPATPTATITSPTQTMTKPSMDPSAMHLQLLAEAADSLCNKEGENDKDDNSKTDSDND